MEYEPLVQFNPTEENITGDSSVWLAARGLMPSRVGNNVACPHFQMYDDMAMRTIQNDELLYPIANGQGLIGLTNGGAGILSDQESNYADLEWSGIWQVNGEASLGCADNSGLIAPFNTFNAGYRYKDGWRPQHVS